MEAVWGRMLSLMRSSFGGQALSVRLGLSCMVLAVLAGCSGHRVIRQDPVDVHGSTHAEALPEAKSIQATYRPAAPDAPPNPQVRYHMPPAFSFEDRPLSDNLASAIELADFEAAVIRAGYWSILEGEKDHTVLAVPNGPFEAFKHEVRPDLMRATGHGYLTGFIGQMILVGHWDMPTIRRKAAKRGGSIQVRTLAGPGYDVILKPTAFGNVEVIGKDGTVTLAGDGYPQSNGVLYMVDSILPYQ